MKYNYSGSLDGKRMEPLVLKAYYAWKNQRSRCNNIKNSSYKRYGARGIRVEYTSREFIGWFLERYPFDSVGNNEFVVGRIDHNKNYSFDNLNFETRSESSNEMITREGRRKPILAIPYGKDFSIAFSSASIASKNLSLNVCSIVRSLRRHSKNITKRKPRMGYHFTYMEDANVI